MYSLKRGAVLDGSGCALCSNASESGAGRCLLQAPGNADIARMIVLRPSQIVTHDLVALRCGVGE
jgi:hypothetical protein